VFLAHHPKYNYVVRQTVISSFIVLAAAWTLTDCSVGSTSPSNSAVYSQTDVRIGTGALAATGRTLAVNYTGWLYDASKADRKGLVFDSNLGKTPFSFALGAGQVIQGWDQGVAGMQVGGIRQLIVPPSLAYGAKRNGPIPAYATLLFEIELLDAQ
jgi:FKBP-type peptidyl-prolyl cis-trans isomerase FkpA